MRYRTDCFDSATVRRLAALADVDPRTMARRLRGETVRGLPGLRIARVLLREDVPVPAHPAEKGSVQ